MTVNDLERRNSPYLSVFSPNSIALLADYVTVVENRPIMSVKYCLPVPVFHFSPILTHPAARSLCDSWATCFIYVNHNVVIFGPVQETLHFAHFYDLFIYNSKQKYCTSNINHSFSALSYFLFYQ